MKISWRGLIFWSLSGLQGVPPSSQNYKFFSHHTDPRYFLSRILRKLWIRGNDPSRFEWHWMLGHSLYYPDQSLGSPERIPNPGDLCALRHSCLKPSFLVHVIPLHFSVRVARLIASAPMIAAGVKCWDQHYLLCCFLSSSELLEIFKAGAPCTKMDNAVFAASLLAQFVIDIMRMLPTWCCSAIMSSAFA